MVSGKYSLYFYFSSFNTLRDIKADLNFVIKIYLGKLTPHCIPTVNGVVENRSGKN